MSVVTNVMLHFAFHERWDDHLNLKDINAVVAPLNNGQKFKFTTESWGGAKHPESDVVAAAFNFLDWDATLDVLAKLPWGRPEHVQLFSQNQEQDAFSIYMLQNGSWVCIYDAPWD